MTGRPRLLVLLPQLPRDPASGAARTTSTIGELLAHAGFDVESIATTATEGHAALHPDDVAGTREGSVLRCDRRGVRSTVLDTGDTAVSGWEAAHGVGYDALFDEALARFRPHLVLTYGGSPADVGRQRRARAAGARLVFGLYNARYQVRGFFDHADLVITPSEFLSGFYRDAIGLDSTPLPTPLWPDDVLAERREPVSLTMVNPSLDKGLLIFATLAAALGERYPEIPIDVFPSRGSPSFLMQAALAAGVDLSSHPRLTIHSTVAVPADIYRRARAVVVPSLVEDAAPRVVAEALVNHVPPIGSDRGGIPEMCRDAGFVLPLPRSLDARSLHAVAQDVVRPWIDLIADLFDGDRIWPAASERAGRAGHRYLPPAVTPRYVECFEALLGSARR